MKYSKGIMWLDDCRIPFVDETEKEGVCKSDKTIKTYNEDWGNTIYNYKRTGGDIKGRFSPNLLVCDDMLNDGSVSKSNSGGISSGNNFGGLTQKYRDRTGVDDKGTNSRYYDLDKWFDKVIDNL
jgi:hypothetical protein